MIGSCSLIGEAGPFISRLNCGYKTMQIIFWVRYILTWKSQRSHGYAPLITRVCITLLKFSLRWVSEKKGFTQENRTICFMRVSGNILHAIRSCPHRIVFLSDDTREGLSAAAVEYKAVRFAIHLHSWQLLCHVPETQVLASQTSPVYFLHCTVSSASIASAAW